MRVLQAGSAALAWLAQVVLLMWGIFAAMWIDNSDTTASHRGLLHLIWLLPILQIAGLFLVIQQRTRRAGAAALWLNFAVIAGSLACTAWSTPRQPEGWTVQISLVALEALCIFRLGKADWSFR
jgi:hypothetical protein